MGAVDLQRRGLAVEEHCWVLPLRRELAYVRVGVERSIASLRGGERPARLLYLDAGRSQANVRKEHQHQLFC